MATPFMLPSLPIAARIGLSALVVVLLGGVAASLGHLVLHHENRDERPGISIDDVTGAYHGIRTRAPLLVAVNRGHGEELTGGERDALRDWLQGDDLATAFDDLDRGDLAPAEILDRRCVSCHSRQSDDPVGKRTPLEYWDDVAAIAFSREVEPTATPIVVASLHTHALGMGSLSIVVALLGLCTRWRGGRAVALLVLGSGAGLALDLACWLPARDVGALVPLLAGGGAAWAGCTTALLIVVLADLWLPDPARGGADGIRAG